MDLLEVTPVESICVGLNLVLVHLLGHVIKCANSDVGGGVVLTHDGLEVSHREETFFDGATPIYGEAVIRQCCKIPPHCKDNAVDEELDLGKVGRALGKAGDGILVVGGEAVYLRDHPDSRGGRAVVRIGLTRCLGTGDLLLSGGGGGGGGGRLGDGLGGHDIGHYIW